MGGVFARGIELNSARTLALTLLRTWAFVCRGFVCGFVRCFVSKPIFVGGVFARGIELNSARTLALTLLRTWAFVAVVSLFADLQTNTHSQPVPFPCAKVCRLGLYVEGLCVGLCVVLYPSPSLWEGFLRGVLS